MNIKSLLKQSNMIQCWVSAVVKFLPISMHSPGKLSDKFSTTKVLLIQKWVYTIIVKCT